MRVASADVAEASRAVRSILCIADTRRASPWCETARAASSALTWRTPGGMSDRYAALVCPSSAGGRR